MPEAAEPGASRGDLQLGRRSIHLASGVAVASVYAAWFRREQVISIFGTIACLVYVLDRIRIHYPEIADRFPRVRELFFRAEERFRESGMVPFAIAILLAILTFPKPIALIAIYTLGVADPLSALVGISWGAHRTAGGKSLEGSAAFFLAAFVCSDAVLALSTSVPAGRIAAVSAATALAATIVEALPLRLDDNLTIPLAAGFAAWVACILFGVDVA
jgi:dolichol kinase